LLLSTCMIPADEDTTLEHLAKALFDTAALAGVPKSARNHIKAIALVIKESEFTPIRRSIELILENSLQSAGSHFQESTKELETSIKEIRPSSANLEVKTGTIDANVTKLSDASNRNATPAPATYASILAHASAVPQLADPRIQAREGIRHRQIKIEIKDPKSPLLNLNDRSLTDKFNQALENGRKILQLIRNPKLNTLILETT